MTRIDNGPVEDSMDEATTGSGDAMSRAVQAAAEQIWWRLDKPNADAVARAAVTAALPVLLADLADRIDGIAMGDPETHYESCSLTQAAKIVRSFASEVSR